MLKPTPLHHPPAGTTTATPTSNTLHNTSPAPPNKHRHHHSDTLQRHPPWSISRSIPQRHLAKAIWGKTLVWYHNLGESVCEGSTSSWQFSLPASLRTVYALPGYERTPMQKLNQLVIFFKAQQHKSTCTCPSFSPFPWLCSSRPRTDEP